MERGPGLDSSQPRPIFVKILVKQNNKGTRAAQSCVAFLLKAMLETFPHVSEDVDGEQGLDIYVDSLAEALERLDPEHGD